MNLGYGFGICKVKSFRKFPGFKTAFLQFGSHSTIKKEDAFCELFFYIHCISILFLYNCRNRFGGGEEHRVGHR